MARSLLTNSFTQFSLGILLVFSSWPSFAQESGQMLRAIDYDHPEQGVRGRIEINQAGKFQPVGLTDEDGYFNYPEECKSPNVQFRVVPTSEIYYPSGGHCPIEGNFVTLTRVEYAENLQINSLKLIERGKFADASMVYAELRARLASADIETAERFEIASYRAAGDWLQLESNLVVVFDPTQTREVASDDLIAEIEEFQTNAGVPASGVLDYRTYRAASDQPIAAYIFKAIGDADGDENLLLDNGTNQLQEKDIP